MQQSKDPEKMSLPDVMHKLQTEDPTRFREVMTVLEYQGEDPHWHQIAELESQNAVPGAVPLNPDNVKSLRLNRDRLIEEKAKLATELNRTQNLLKLQVDIDR